MTPVQRKAIAKALEELEKQLIAKTALRIEPNADAEDRADEDEQPLNEMHQAIASNRNKADIILLNKVRAAQRRLKEDPDDYGNCTDCGDEVPMGRMKAMPWADLCVDCQSKKDKKGVGTARKHLTDYSEPEED